MMVTQVYDEIADNFAVLSIVHDRLASWNLCLHQYTIGHSSKQCLLVGGAARGNRVSVLTKEQKCLRI
jgi:hypothetical protein